MEEAFDLKGFHIVHPNTGSIPRERRIMHNRIQKHAGADGVDHGIHGGPGRIRILKILPVDPGGLQPCDHITVQFFLIPIIRGMDRLFRHAEVIGHLPCSRQASPGSQAQRLHLLQRLDAVDPSAFLVLITITA